MKYIDADRLRAEIEDLIVKYSSVEAKGPILEGYKGGRLIGYRDVINKLNSLQQEQPQVADASKMEQLEVIDDKYIERSLAKVRLEKELAEYLQYWEDDEELGLILTTDTGVIQIELDDIRDLARHFAEWGAEHARKEK